MSILKHFPWLLSATLIVLTAALPTSASEPEKEWVITYFSRLLPDAGDMVNVQGRFALSKNSDGTWELALLTATTGLSMGSSAAPKVAATYSLKPVKGRPYTYVIIDVNVLSGGGRMLRDVILKTGGTLDFAAVAEEPGFSAAGLVRSRGITYTHPDGTDRLIEATLWESDDEPENRGGACGGSF